MHLSFDLEISLLGIHLEDKASKIQNNAYKRLLVKMLFVNAKIGNLNAHP